MSFAFSEFFSLHPKEDVVQTCDSIPHHKHGKYLQLLNPNSQAYVRIHLLGETALQLLSGPATIQQNRKNSHSNSTSGRDCGEVNMTPKPCLYIKMQNNLLLYGTSRLGIPSAASLRWAGVCPQLSHISKCWTQKGIQLLKNRVAL